MTRSVLFICTGNYYRSRFAEAVFNAGAAERKLGWTAFSRGLAAHLIEGDLSPFTRDALARRGIALTHTGPTRVSLTDGDLERAARRIALRESEHRPMVDARFPAWAGRVEYWDVADVDIATPEQALPVIEQRVRELLDELALPASEILA